MIVPGTLLIVPVELAARIGVDDALLLQQIHYWLTLGGHERDGHRWIYNSYSEWTVQFPFWNKDKVRRVVERLRRRGLLLTASYNHHAYDRTLWYTIDYTAVAALGLPMPDPLPAPAQACHSERSAESRPPALLPAPAGPPAPASAPTPANTPAPARPAMPPPAPTRVPAVPASVPGTPGIVCAAAGTCHSERSAESRHGDRTAATSSGTHAPRYDADTARYGADAPRYGTHASRCGADASRCGNGAPRSDAAAPTIPETTTEITSEINTRERESDGAPSPSAFEHFTMTATLTGWLAAECATLGVPPGGVNAAHETDKWRDEIRAGRRAVPADAAADWRQWMRRALAYTRHHPPTGAPVHGPVSLATRSAQADASDLDARKDAAAAQLRELVLGRLSETAAGSAGAAAL
jgi:hypothetical protein